MALFGKKDEDPIALMQKGDYKKAIKILQAKLKSAPSDLSLKLRLAEAFEGTGDKESAARIYIDEANDNLKARQKEKAFALFKKAEKLMPGDPEIKKAIEAVDQKQENDSFSFDISMDGEAPQDSVAAGGTRDVILELLQNLFDPPKEGLEEIADACSVITLEDGKILISEGDEGDSLYLIIDGELSVLTDVGGRSTCVSKLSKGEIVGEASFLNKVPRTATLVADGAVTVAELKGGDARKALKDNPKLMKSLEKILEKRVEDFIRKMKSRS